MLKSLAFDAMAPHVEWKVYFVGSIPAYFSMPMVHLASMSLEMGLRGLMKLTKSCLDLLISLVLDKYALKADTTLVMRERCEMDCGQWVPCVVRLKECFRSNAASSLSISRQSRDKPTIVWPLFRG